MNVCRRSAAIPCVLGLVLWLGAGASVRAEDFKAPISKLELKDGDCVVFLGDSITHQCLYTQYVEDYYYTRYPKLRVKFHNAGVGGARAADAMARFRRDVAAYKPKYVTVLLGMNDGSYRPYDENTFQTYRNGMTELVAEILGTGGVPILMTPTMYDSRAARIRGEKDAAKLEFYNSTLAYYGTWLREIAVEGGHGFVDMYSLLNNLTLEVRKSDPKFTLIKDAVHPDAPGQFVMAFALLHGMDVAPLVSQIQLKKQADGTFAAEAKGGQVSGQKGADQGVEFTWSAEALPYVVPPEAQSTVKMLYAGHRLGRETLQIDGLAPGRYDLRIDGQVVGTFPGDQLAGGIELQDNAQTPQYQQAAQVAELNKQRNAGPVRSLRNQWSQMQGFYRLQDQAKNAPNDETIAKNLADQTKKVEGLEDRIAKHEQEARDIESKIFEINQPKPRQYRITPTATAAGN